MFILINLPFSDNSFLQFLALRNSSQFLRFVSNANSSRIYSITFIPQPAGMMSFSPESTYEIYITMYFLCIIDNDMIFMFPYLIVNS